MSTPVTNLPSVASRRIASTKTASRSPRTRSSTPSSTTCSTYRASSRRWPPRPTTTWRWPTRCATASAALDQHRGRVHQAGFAHGVVPVGRVPDGPASRQQPHQPRHLRRPRAPRWPSSVSTSKSCWPTKTSPASATAASGGSRPASSTRWPRSRFRRWATASATSSASSSRRSSTAGRWRRPTSGCASAIPGRSRGPSGAVEVKFGGHTEVWYDEHAPQARALGAAPHRQWHSLRHAHPRLPREHREHAAAVEGRSARVVRLRHLQSRRLLRRGQPEGGQREPHQGAVSERRAGAAARSCASSSSTSSCAARCRTCCASAACRRFRPSASTRSSRSS